MKRYIFVIIVMLSCLSIQAQEKGRFRVQGNIGLDFPAKGVGGSIDLLDIRYNLKDNWNAGAKIGGAMMFRNLNQIDEQTAENTLHLNSNFMLVSDYYFNNGTSYFAPFVGASVGAFRIRNLYMIVDLESDDYNQADNFPDPSKTFGGALRAGFELWRFRMAMEYYIIPKTDKYNIESNLFPVGTSANNYLTINVGFYFGGGRWMK